MPWGESTVRPEDVGKSYDQLAERWNAEGFLRENGIAQHERAIAFLQDKEWALDIGCGSSGRLIGLFLRHGFQVEGVDISTRMVELARQRHPQVTIHHADICRWNFPRRYDLISGWDSIWHVPLEDQAELLAKIIAGLSPGGVLIFTTGGVDGPADKVDAAMGPRMYHSALGIPATLRAIEDAGCVCRHLEYDQYPEPHVYIIAQRKG
ncbi:MAG: class I SAM-dependent methyltransferase [Candidatus Eisenbacteria bacterium]